MGKAKNTKSIILAIAAIFLFQITAFAANTWSNAGTINLNRKTGWKRTTTTGVYLVNTKSTDSKNVTVYTVSKTMVSYPQFRMVNSNNAARSASFTVPPAGKQKTNSSNTGVKGYNYYASVKPSWNQVSNNQSIRLQFKSH